MGEYAEEGEFKFRFRFRFKWIGRGESGVSKWWGGV